MTPERVPADPEPGGGRAVSRLPVMTEQLRRQAARLEVWRAGWARAQEFVALTGGPVEAWMLWAGWTGSVGCDECQTCGPELARCWGSPGCHGYEQGCGCAECELRHEGALRAAGIGAEPAY